MSDVEKKSDVDRMADYVGKAASRLQREYRKNLGSAVAELAILRRGVHQEPGEDVRVTAITLGDLYSDAARLPDEPQPAERAAHAALTLFAIHQQSHRDRSMHRKKYGLGRSLRLLGKHVGENGRNAVRHRFTTLATADSLEETLHHARGLIQQLRAAGIPLDYAQFARDLYWLQEAGGERVRRTWGLDFYRVRHPEDDDSEDDDDSGDDSDDTTDNS